MHTFGTGVLIIGLAVLLIVGLLRLIRDLCSSSVIAAPSPNEERAVENTEDARLSGPTHIAGSSASGTFVVKSRSGRTPLEIRRDFGTP